eukprot:654126-Amphidinium_carterae.1
MLIKTLLNICCNGMDYGQAVCFQIAGLDLAAKSTLSDPSKQCFSATANLRLQLDKLDTSTK